MITIFSEKHRLRNAKTELFGGLLVSPYENPSRADIILERVNSEKLGEVIAPKEFGMKPVLALHDAGFVEFLRVAWDKWSQTEYKGEVIPTCWPARRMSTRIPDFIEGKVGYYAMSSETSINKGTWEAALASKDVALTGAELLLNGDEKGIFSLCRPPGHHAAFDMFGGYCFLNNAAIAAQWFRDNGIDRVTILDVDFHHGNGTQDIFYEREDVLYLIFTRRPLRCLSAFFRISGGNRTRCRCRSHIQLAPISRNTIQNMVRQTQTKFSKDRSVWG